MSSDRWTSITHVIPTAHTRGFERGIRNEKSDKLRFAVKQFLPKQSAQNADGFTIIMVHGVGAAKECYEPFFDDLYDSHIPIKSIWAPDAASNGESYFLNKDCYGDQVNWIDFARDVWHMINHFQDAISSPIIGIGHSLGSGAIAMISSWHPRLFTGVIFLEPAMGPRPGVKWPTAPKHYPGVLAAKRKSKWPSRDEARTYFKKNRYYQTLDSRVFEKTIQFELRDDSEQAEFGRSNSTDTPVTLTTPSYIEAYTWMSPSPPLPGINPDPEDDNPPPGMTIIPGFSRHEAHLMYKSLPSIRPKALIVWGDKSPVNPEWNRIYYAAQVGSGVGGSGGIRNNSLKLVSVADAGHAVCLEKPKATAASVATWLQPLWEDYQKQQKEKSNQAPFLDTIQPEYLERINKL